MILLCGPSASGKTEIAKCLREKYGIVKAITHTSRAPRAGEQDGVDYFFVSKAKFEELLPQGFFVEHTLYNGNYYGCSKGQINDNKCVVVDPNGLKSFLALHDASVVTFYLTAAARLRRERMMGRGDSPSSIEQRLAGDRVDFAPDKIAKTDFVLATDSYTIEEMAAIVYRDYLAALKARGLTPFALR